MDFARTSTPLGEMLLAGSSTALVGAWFMGQKHFPPLPQLRLANAPLLSSKMAPRKPDFPLLQQAVEELAAYFASSLHVFSMPFDPVGTAFQQSVWQALRTIPYGEKRTYTEIADASGNAGAFRAVGAAIGKNPLSIFIPCHRVMGKSGKLTGYAGGLDRKAALLKLEGVQ